MRLSSGALNRFESVSLEAGGDGGGWTPGKEAESESLNLDPSAGQATLHNIPCWSPCSRLKASRSEHAPVSLAAIVNLAGLSSLPGGWFHGPRVHMAIHCCTLRRTPMLGFMLHWCFLDKGLAFSSAPGPSISCSRSCLWHRQWRQPLLKDLRISPGQHCSQRAHGISHLYYLPGLCRHLPGCLGFTALVLWIHLCSTKKCPKWSCPSAKELWETLVSDAKGHIQLDFDIQILFIVQ